MIRCVVNSHWTCVPTLSVSFRQPPPPPQLHAITRIWINCIVHSALSVSLHFHNRIKPTARPPPCTLHNSHLLHPSHLFNVPAPFTFLKQLSTTSLSSHSSQGINPLKPPSRPHHPSQPSSSNHSQMLHAIKRKTVGVAAARHEPVNAEFDTLRQSLDNVSNALTAALEDIENAEKSWTSLVISASHFASGMHTLYPRDDDLRTLFKKTLSEVEGPLPKEMEEIIEPKSKVKTIQRMVRAYLTEIDHLTKEYVKVETARKDFAMYQTKVDKLEKKESPVEKQTRNLDKLESSKASYDSTLEGVIHRMKTTYDKSPTMFRAAYVAFWLYHSQMGSLVDRHYKPAFTYSKQHAETLLTVPEPSHVGSSTE